MPCIHVMPNRLYPENSSLQGCKSWIVTFTHRAHFMYSSGLSVSALENGEMNGNRALGLSPEICWGADKSLARPGKKQARNNAMGARDFKNIEARAVIKFFFFCKARRRRKFTPLCQKRYLVSFLVGLRAFQHPCSICFFPATCSPIYPL